ILHISSRPLPHFADVLRYARNHYYLATIYYMALKKNVSIIIPNFNGQALLEEYLPYAIAAAENAGIAYEVIIVDDASTDQSVDFIKTHYKDVILLKNPVNQGFSYSCNKG